MNKITFECDRKKISLPDIVLNEPDELHMVNFSMLLYSHFFLLPIYLSLSLPLRKQNRRPSCAKFTCTFPHT